MLSLYVSRSRHVARRPARRTCGQVGAACDRQPAHGGAGADRARRRRAPHHHPAAGYSDRAFRGADRGRRDRCRCRRQRFDGRRLRYSRSGRRCTDDRRDRQTPGSAVADRMGDADLGHDRRAENGRAQSCRLDGILRGESTGSKRRVGHVLRYPPLWRVADFPARGARRQFAGALKRRRAGSRSSRPLGRARRDASPRHADALAPRADVAVDQGNLAALCPPIRRDRRPGDPRQLAGRVSERRRQSCFRLDRSRRRLRSRPTE